MEWLLKKIKEYDSKTAIVWNKEEYTYTRLFNAILRYSKEINSVIKPGEVVALVSDYSFNAIAAFFALAQNKNIIVPIATSLSKEIEERIAVSRATYRISIKPSNLQIQKTNSVLEEYKLVTQLKERSNAGIILFSSGTTGKPKAMIHDLNVLIDSFKNKKEKDLILLLFLMFDHVGGLNTLLNCLVMGMKIIVPDNRDTEHISSLIEKYQVQILPSSPTFLNLMLISEAYKHHNLSSLKMITYGTEPMPAGLLLRLKNIFTKAKLLQTFGTSETGIAQVSSLSSASTFIKIDDPNIETKIVDGELWMRSKTQILGYLNASMERFTEDGWYKTGDMVEKGEDGYIKIVGRKSDIINVGGQKVLPCEVEGAILKMPRIAACVVYGERSVITGQIVVADIVVSTSSEISSENLKKELRSFLKTKLESYKMPVKINIKDSLVQTSTFKLKRDSIE